MQQDRRSVSSLVARIPIVSAFGPIITRPFGGEFYPTDTLYQLDAVLSRRSQPQWRAVFGQQRFAVHLISKKRLRMQNALHIPTHEIAVVGRSKRNIRHKLFGMALDI